MQGIAELQLVKDSAP